jgi:hypothetical protein
MEDRLQKNKNILDEVAATFWHFDPKPQGKKTTPWALHVLIPQPNFALASQRVSGMCFLQNVVHPDPSDDGCSLLVLMLLQESNTGSVTILLLGRNKRSGRVQSEGGKVWILESSVRHLRVTFLSSCCKKCGMNF